MCMSQEFCASCRPSEYMGAYMRGHVHLMPVYGDRAQYCLAEGRRKEAFLKALERQDVDIDSWPEFHQMLRHAGVEWCYTEGLLPAPAMTLFVKGRGKSVVDWIRRGRRLRARGVDPMTRHGYRKAMAEFGRILLAVETSVKGDDAKNIAIAA